MMEMLLWYRVIRSWWKECTRWIEFYERWQVIGWPGMLNQVYKNGKPYLLRVEQWVGGPTLPLALWCLVPFPLVPLPSAPLPLSLFFPLTLHCLVPTCFPGLHRLSLSKVSSISSSSVSSSSSLGIEAFPLAPRFIPLTLHFLGLRRSTLSPPSLEASSPSDLSSSMFSEYCSELSSSPSRFSSPVSEA